MTSLLKRLARRSLTLRIATIGTSTMLLIAALQITPVQAASHVSRVSLSQVANGYTVKATYNMDVVIRFDGNEHIAYVWGSNNLLFNPRFVTGGKLLVLQSTARPQNMQTLPQITVPLPTLSTPIVSETQVPVTLRVAIQPLAESQTVLPLRFAPRPVLDTPGSQGSPVLPITPEIPSGSLNQVLPVQGFPGLKEAKLPLLAEQFKVVQTIPQPVSTSAEGQR